MPLSPSLHVPTDASKRLSITCAELSNVTFTNAPPFNVLGVPECGDAVRPQLVLYLPKNNARWGSANANHDQSYLTC